MSDTGEITLLVINIHDCPARDSISINVQTKPEITVPDSIDLCAGLPSSVETGADPYYRFTWYPNYNIWYNFLQNPKLFPELDTTYYVFASNDCENSDTHQLRAIVHPLPLPVITADTTVIWRERSALLSVADTFTDYAWMELPGNSTSSIITDAYGFPDVQVSPFYSSWYRVRVTDAYGCENTDTIFIQVDPRTVIMVPSGFSPNGDGMNDRLFVLGTLNIKEINSFRIFNRWGEELIDIGISGNTSYWDGSYKGFDQPTGTYVWMIEATDLEGKKVYQNGTITLLR